jgi:flagella basal body P-ring formation protein FlgA
MSSFAELLALTALILAPPSAAAPAGTSGASFDARVAAAVAETWGVNVNRVRLTWGEAPAGAVPDAGTAFRLAGRGLDGGFVVVLDPERAPRSRSLRAALAETTWTATRPLSAGTVLAASDLKLETRWRYGAPRTARHEPPGPGWTLRRPVAAGESVEWPAAVPAPLVEGGGPVRLVWSRGEVRITLLGRAMNSAGRGERVRARVDGTGGQVIATAIEPGVALLSGGER